MAGEVTYASAPWLKSYDNGVPEHIIMRRSVWRRSSTDQRRLIPSGMALNFRVVPYPSGNKGDGRSYGNLSG